MVLVCNIYLVTGGQLIHELIDAIFVLGCEVELLYIVGEYIIYS
jgi:hypothetical protein